MGEFLLRTEKITKNQRDKYFEIIQKTGKELGPVLFEIGALTPQEIKKAYFHLAKLYHPDRHADPRLGDMKQKLETLFASINDAYNILSVKEKRDQYNLDLAGGTRKYGNGELKATDKADKQDNNPEYIYYQGLALAHMPRRRHEAEEHFIKAVSMAPSHTDYSLELGNFYAKNGLKTKAMAVYQDALKRDPKSDKVKLAIKNAGGWNGS